jgi:error-prone DNA polymerase
VNPSPLAIRLGLRYVKSLSRRTADRILEERAARPFDGVTDLGRRTGASGAELLALAEVGALASFGRERKDAMWQALALPQARDLLQPAVRETSDPALPPMTPHDEMVADFRGTGLTTGPHPMAFLRDRLARERVTAAADLVRVPDGRRVRVAGLILVRQRPGTAKGVYFATLEDETGFCNLVAMPDVFAASRALLSTATFLMADGVLQNRDGVVSVKIDRAREVPGDFEHPSRDFF